MIGRMKVVDRTGHTETPWATTEDELTELREAGQTVITQEEADTRFRELINQNFVAYRKDEPGADYEISRREPFDPAAHEYLMVPPMAGG